MALYYIHGITGATAGTADQVIAALWNASTTRRIKALEISCFKVPGTAITPPYPTYWCRTTSRGTVTLTETPNADNDAEGAAAPPSGAVLDLTYSVSPALAAPTMYVPLVYHAGSGDGFVLPIPRGITILPSTGLGIIQENADNASGFITSFVFED